MKKPEVDATKGQGVREGRKSAPQPDPVQPQGPGPYGPDSGGSPLS